MSRFDNVSMRCSYKQIVEDGGGKFISTDFARNVVYFYDETETRVSALGTHGRERAPRPQGRERKSFRFPAL